LPEVFEPLRARYNFSLDAAANRENAKCERYFDLEDDGLKQSWSGERVWCNPPYSDLYSWVKKARDEVETNGCEIAVLLLPANRCEQKFWQELIEPHRDGRGNGNIQTEFMAGRPRFGWDESRPKPEKGDRPPFGLVVVEIAPLSPLKVSRIFGKKPS
jgi:phage N-6-adenine-methyltransferase